VDFKQSGIPGKTAAGGGFSGYLAALLGIPGKCPLPEERGHT